MDRKEFVKGAVAAEGTAVLSHHAFATEGEETKMKTDFDKFRKWRHYQVASAIVLIVLVVSNIILSAFLGFSRPCNLSVCIVSVITGIMGLKAISYSRCPHCGKYIMSKWLGRDSAGRNCTKRIEKRLPILCFHCGQEVDTD